jgi:hypothetical protein
MQGPETAKRFAATVAYGVEFFKNVKTKGFCIGDIGQCWRADEADASINIPNACVKLKLMGGRCIDPKGIVVEACEELYLLPDGSLYALAIKSGVSETSPQDIAQDSYY